MHNDFRLYTSKQAFEVYNENCGDKKLFPQKSDMYFWCVVLGYHNSPEAIPTELGPDRQGEIHWGAFDDAIQKPFLNMIVIEASNGFEVLADRKDQQEKFRSIIQGYAELGYTLLANYMNHDYTADKLLEFIIEQELQ